MEYLIQDTCKLKEVYLPQFGKFKARVPAYWLSFDEVPPAQNGIGGKILFRQDTQRVGGGCSFPLKQLLLKKPRE